MSPPEWFSLAGFLFIGFASEALVEWHLSGERPLIFANLGALGDLIDLGTTFVVAAGGLSLIVWSFMKLSWYLPIAFFVVSMIIVKVLSAPFVIRAFVPSALTPLLCAVAIIVLHWFTWLA